MSENKKKEIIRELYDNAFACNMDCGYGMNHPTSRNEKSLRDSLGKASDVGLIWGDVYEFERARVQEEGVRSIARAKEGGLEVGLVRNEDGVLCLRAVSDSLEVVDDEMTLGAFYDEQMERKITAVGIVHETRCDIDSDKKVALDDYTNVLNYFN
jgi:hypothetical protein